MKKFQSNDGYGLHYPCAPIFGINNLAKALGIPELRLVRLSAIANNLYRLAAEETKKDGSKRQTFDARPPLKAIQIRIKERILARVAFPEYLNGSVRGRSTRTNAAPHVDAKIAIQEDIANFFPSISGALVKKIWCEFFGFSDDVGALLSLLTLKDDGVPQGAVTSSYLANLVFWAHEPDLVRNFARQGYEYTRFVDDISISSKHRLSTAEQQEVVRLVYGMLRKHGLKPKRKKHEVQSARRRMTTTKLVNNTQVSLPAEFRRATRTAVYQLETRVAFGEHDADLRKELVRVSSRVGRLNSYHPTEGAKLKARLAVLRQRMEPTAQHTPPPVPVPASLIPSAGISSTPPWL